METYTITTKQDDLKDDQVAEIFEIVASAIRNEEMTELMDGTLHLHTIYGEVWLEKSDWDKN